MGVERYIVISQSGFGWVLGQDHVTSIFTSSVRTRKKLLMRTCWLDRVAWGLSVAWNSGARCSRHMMTTPQTWILLKLTQPANGVDDIQALEKGPNFACFCAEKVYIDEVHTCWKSAFNAIKTLEKPEHVVFILATMKRRQTLAILVAVSSNFFRPIPTKYDAEVNEYSEERGFAIEGPIAELPRRITWVLVRLINCHSGIRPATNGEYISEDIFGTGDATMPSNLLDSYPSDDNEKVLSIFQNSCINYCRLLQWIWKNQILLGWFSNWSGDRHPRGIWNYWRYSWIAILSRPEKPAA